MQGQTCLITGATSGIGRAAALRFAELGAETILVGRNEARGQAVVQKIQKRSPGSAVFFRADLSNLREVRNLARQIADHTGHLDALINNAGARFDRYQRSADGYELTFATNHLGHFLLTCLLSDLMFAASAARVITVSSCTHAAAPADGKWLLPSKGYERKTAYARSKLANLLFAYELAGRTRGTSLTSNAVDPGIVATRFGRNNGLVSWAKHLIYHGLRRELVSPPRAAETIVFLANSDATRTGTGKYFRDKQEVRSAAASYDRELSRKLWNDSLEWTGLTDETVPCWARSQPGGTGDSPVPSGHWPDGITERSVHS